MSVDKEPFGVLFLIIFVFLPSLGSMFFFLLRWLLSTNATWEFVVSLILVIVTGILLLSLLPLVVYATKETIVEIKYYFEVRKEEKALALEEAKE